MKSVKSKIENLLKHLNKGVFEKEEVIALSVLSSIAGESIFLLGAPGVAKSLIARKLKYIYKDGTSFEYLMNRFSTPDEIFGPVSISQLKNNDKYERIVKNYLPTATVVFLDEIWKAGPSIQNALLTVLNERIYRNGEQEIKVPMRALISASNELPAKGEGLEALWDRFLIRLIVEGIKDKKNFNKMISQSLNPYEYAAPNELKITEEEHNLWSKAIDKIEIPDYVFSVIHVIRGYIERYNQKEEHKQNPIYISDRRWRKIVRLLRTSAFLNDRESVDLMDCFLIQHCIWNDVEQIPAVSQFVKDAIQKHGYSLTFDFKGLKEELEDFKAEIKKETEKIVKGEKLNVLADVRKNYYEIEELNLLIEKKDYDKLKTSQSKNISLYHYDYKNNRIEKRSDYYITKQDSTIKNLGHKIIVNNQEYKLKTKIAKEKHLITKKPHKKVEEYWDNRVVKYLEATNAMREKIEAYRTKDLQHLRTNLFASPELANIVETHLNDTIKEIEKFEIEIRKIESDYKQLKNDGKIIGNEEEIISIKDLDGSLNEDLINKIIDHGITDSSIFWEKDIYWFFETLKISKYDYQEIKKAIEEKLNEK